jgi:hypothetical protein
MYFRDLIAWEILTLLGLLSAAYNWTAIEAGIGLVCACFPVIAPLFKAKSFQEQYGAIKEKKSEVRNLALLAPLDGSVETATATGTPPKPLCMRSKPFSLTVRIAIRN